MPCSVVPDAEPFHWAPAPQYFILLLLIFLLEIIAGVLAYVYYQQVRGACTGHGGPCDTATPAVPALANLLLGPGGGV